MTLEEIKNLPLGTIIKYTPDEFIIFYKVVERWGIKMFQAEYHYHYGLNNHYVGEYSQFNRIICTECYISSVDELNEVKSELL